MTMNRRFVSDNLVLWHRNEYGTVKRGDIDNGGDIDNKCQCHPPTHYLPYVRHYYNVFIHNYVIIVLPGN